MSVPAASYKVVCITECIAPLILKLGTRQSLVVRTLCPRRKELPVTIE